jgi:hypothetical protein
VVVDRFSVLGDGATSITLGADGAAKITDHMVRGDRPWVIAAPSHLATSSLPPAATE